MKRKALSLLAAVMLSASFPAATAFAGEELVLTPPTPSLQTKGEEDKDDHESLIDKINGGNAAIMGALGKKDWEALAKAAPRTKDWREDLIAVAQTQIGYTENSDGMTHYTEWAKLEEPTEWNALFVSWIADQAGLKERHFPHGVTYDELRSKLSRMGAVKNIRRAAYPLSGDLALIETKTEKKLGFIVYVSGGYASMILGDVNGAVTRATYQVNGPEFKQYIDLNVLMEHAGIEVGKGGEVPEIPEGGLAAWTNTNAVYLRSEPTTACKSLTTIKKAETALLVTSAALQEDGYIWYGVDYQSFSGYVRGDLLTLDQAALSEKASEPDSVPGLVVQERVVNIEVVHAGEDQLFNITFELYGAASYEWHELRTTEEGTTDRILFDATTQTLTLSAKNDAAYSYYCVATIVTDGKSVEVTSKTTALDVTSEASAPIVAEAILGEEVNFTYTNADAVSYQWYIQYTPDSSPYALYNGDVYTGADAAKLTFYALRAHADTLYFCIARDINNNELRSSYYTLSIKGEAELTTEDLSKYVDELAHMSLSERHIALSQTWNIYLDDNASTLADNVRAYWEQNLSAVYPNLLCTCGQLTAPGSTHNSSCSWYVSSSSSTSKYADCASYPDACAYLSTWLTRKAGPLEIYNHIASLDSAAQQDLIYHANAAHPQAAGLLCSCTGTGTAPAPGTAHTSTCPWYLAGVDSAALASRCTQDAAFAQWAQAATADMIARALTVATLDHLIISNGLLYVAREANPCAMIDQNGHVTDMMTGLVIAQIVDGVFTPVH